MKTLKKLTAFLIIAILALQTALVASAAEDTVNLVVDPDAKTLTVQGTSTKGDKFLLGMLLYDTDAYKADNTVKPLSIFDCRTNAQGEYKFESIKFGTGSYLKMLTVRVDMGDNVVDKETVIAFEDTPGSDSISGFATAVSALTEDQIKNYYTVLVDFAGLTLKNPDGTYASDTYKKIVELGKEAELAKLLKADATLLNTKGKFADAVKEDMAVVAVANFETEDIYKTLFTELNVTVNESNAGEKEQAVAKIKGNTYTSMSAITGAINAELVTIQGSSGTGSDNSNVPTGSYTPIGGGGGGGGGDFKPTKKDPIVIMPADPVTPEENGLSDISGHWSENDVKALSDAKIVSGYPDNTFKPDGNVTRAEAASIIKKAFDYNVTEKENEFSDVLKTDWYYLAINTLFESGIMKGDGNSFKPNDYLTREDLCVLIYRCLNNPEANAENSFNDKEEIAEYAKSAVNYLSEGKIVEGYENSFMPKAYVTRGQICAIINRTLKAVNK